MKKHRIFQRIALIVTMGVAITSCEQFAEGVSPIDPTSPTDASMGQVLNAAEVGYIGVMEGELARIGGMWGGAFTGGDRQYLPLANYTSTSPDYDNAWSNLYANTLKNFRIAEAKAAAVNNRRVLAVAQILEAHLMGTTAAAWGDVPFTQAANIGDFPNPAFDPQREVYAGVIKLLNDALTNINTALDGTDYDGDFFYTGDDGDAYWTAVANSLKAKFHLHLGQYTEALAAAQAGIQDASGDVIAPHGDSYNIDFNIYYSFGVYDRPGYMWAAGAFAPRLIDPTDSDIAVSKNNAKTDESDRFSFLYWDDDDMNYDLNYSGFDYDGEADGAFSNRAPFPLITYRETQLIEAEATLRTTNDVDAALAELNEYRAYLDNGGYFGDYYTGAGKYADLDAADFAPGGLENPGTLSAADALYREIVEEKYVSMIGTIELFIDLHRKGYGSFANQQNWATIGLTPVQGSTIPQRFLIPQSEINSNTSTPNPVPGLFQATEIFN